MNAIARDVFRVYRTHKSLALTLTFQPDRFLHSKERRRIWTRKIEEDVRSLLRQILPLVVIILLLLDGIELYIYIYTYKYVSSLRLKLDKGLYNYLSSLINLLVSLIDAIELSYTIDT